MKYSDYYAALGLTRNATRETGLRLAIGALECDVLLHFLIESVVLAALGGLIGILIATSASYAISKTMDVSYAVDMQINDPSLFFSAGIGVVFGRFLAQRAARMDPIEALRHE
jgi:putative ABC transport system permease protein